LLDPKVVVDSSFVEPKVLIYPVDGCRVAGMIQGTDGRVVPDNRDPNDLVTAPHWKCQDAPRLLRGNSLSRQRALQYHLNETRRRSPVVPSQVPAVSPLFFEPLHDPAAVSFFEDELCSAICHSLLLDEHVALISHGCGDTDALCWSAFAPHRQLNRFPTLRP